LLPSGGVFGQEPSAAASDQEIHARMNTLQAIIIAILQGATELFPVSSLGHAVVLPPLLGWRIDQASDEFLPFLVMLHLGTAVALLLYFWKDWWALAIGVLGLAPAPRVREARRVFLLIVVATIPAVIMGALLEKFVRGLFASPFIAAAFLVVNGLLLLFGERLRGRGRATRELSSLTVTDAFTVGCWQCTALIPGISRSGATIVGGLLRGINHEGAAHFSFLIATPIIFGATVHQVPKLLHASVPPGVLSLSAIAAVVAGVTAFLSTAFLMRYFRQHDKWALNPFAYYCIVAGLGAIAIMYWMAGA
jgi:undecaprenyl-diphosphatase